MKRILGIIGIVSFSLAICGSISGNINVTVGQPHIKVDSITVGGR